MSFFPTSPNDGDEIGPNTNGTYFKYVAADDKWIILNNLIPDHNDMDGLNDGDNYEHITATEKSKIHDENHDNTKHTTNYHTESDGIGVATIHSDITSVGSGAIITTGERTALHPKQHAMDAIAEHTRTDITTLNASTSFHGFLKKLDNDALNFMNGQGNWAVPAGGEVGFNPPIGFIGMFSGSWTDNSTIPGWYKCDGNNGTPNLVDKFVRGAITSGGSGGSDDSVVVSHVHQAKTLLYPRGTGAEFRGLSPAGSWEANLIESTGVSGVGANVPVFYELLFIMRIS